MLPRNVLWKTGLDTPREMTYMRIRISAVEFVSLRRQSVIPNLLLEIEIDTYTTPAIVGAAQVHAALEATTFTVFTTHCRRAALGDTVGTAVIGAEPAFAPRAAAAVDANSVTALYLKGIHENLPAVRTRFAFGTLLSTSPFDKRMKHSWS